MKPPQRREPGTAIPDIFVRETMPASAERVFALMTRADQMALWLCDEAQSESKVGGAVVAKWHDPTGQTAGMTRCGTWVEFEPPRLAYLAWKDSDRHDRGSDELKIAVAETEDGCAITVVSPCPQHFEHTSIGTVQDATRKSWQQLLQELAAMLREEKHQSS